jgi:ribonuclease D
MHENSIFIEQHDQLESACRRWMAFGAIGLDTEFERTRTYYSRPALVQVFDGEQVALIDPLTIDDFEPLAELLQCPDVMKVMHAAEGDNEVLEQLTGVVPKPIFDTQIAAAFAGHGHSLGYRKLTQMLLGEELAKDETRSDWLKRPLSDAQVAYAALDVVHLLPMYRLLERALVDIGRDAWLREEICRIQRRREADRDPRGAYQRIRRTRHLDVEGLTALRELAAWREQEARSRDLPRQMVLKDTALLALASALPADEDALAGLSELSADALSRYSGDLLGVMASAAAGDPAPAPEPAIERRFAPRLKAVKSMVRERSEALGIPAPLLAQSRILESLVQATASGSAELPEELRGWREPVIGEQLLNALKAMDEES